MPQFESMGCAFCLRQPDGIVMRKPSSTVFHRSSEIVEQAANSPRQRKVLNVLIVIQRPNDRTRELDCRQRAIALAAYIRLAAALWSRFIGSRLDSNSQPGSLQCPTHA